MKVKAILFDGVFCLFLLFLFSRESLAIERKRDQFLTEPSYLIVPLPYSIPGIGSGVMITGLVGNIWESYTDVYGLYITGDAQGEIIGVDDFHLVPETLIVNLFYQYINKVAVNNYDKRGMDTEKDDYKLIELSKVDSREANLTATFFERRLEFFASFYSQAIRVDRIRNSDGELIAELEEPYENETETTSFGLLIDYTDDYQDPQKGARFSMRRSHTPPGNEVDPDFYVLHYDASLYLPIGIQSKVAFNAYLSDAVVTREGETNRDKIREELDLQCPPPPYQSAECEKTQDELVEQFWASRKYGTAASLGGQDRMRAYPQSRFQGAHALYYSAEFRWNLTDQEFTPFNYWIWKDVRTAFQLAFFYERGGVADKIGDLQDSMRDSYGAGARLVTASGYVYRADYAVGDEGSQITIIFNYPW